MAADNPTGNNILGSVSYSAADWVRLAEQGSRVASIAVGHGGKARSRWLAFMGFELTAYCDESGTEKKDLVVAGFLAPASRWLALESEWRKALATAQPPLDEFHMHDCQMGTGEFKGRDDRIELRDKFYSIITNFQPEGFAVRIDLGTFPAVQEALHKSIRAGFNEAYLHGFTALLQFMSREIDHQPKEERIEFVFDEQDQFSGRALEIHRAYVHGDVSRAVFRSRIGGISFRDSKTVVPLQAADTLAYRIHREHRDTTPRRIAEVSYLSDWPRVGVAFLGSEAIAGGRSS